MMCHAIINEEFSYFLTLNASTLRFNGAVTLNITEDMTGFVKLT